ISACSTTSFPISCMCSSMAASPRAAIARSRSNWNAAATNGSATWPPEIAMSQTLAARIAAEFATAAEQLPEGIVSAERRRLAVAALGVQGLRAGRDENWKYANLRALERVRFTPAGAVPATAEPPAPLCAADLPAVLPGYSRFVFVDGAFAAELSSARVPVAAAVGLPAHAIAGDARFALLNDAFANDAAVLQVGPGAASLVEVVFVARAAGSVAASYPRLQVQVASTACLTLIERHVSVAGDANFTNVAVEIDVGRGGKFTHFRVQQMGMRATWIDTLSADIAQDACYQQHLVQLGALAARSTVHVRLCGPGAAVKLHALSAAKGPQVHDAYALVEHIAPHATSEQVFRGIAAG